MKKISVRGTDYRLSDAQSRALLILVDRWMEEKRTSAGDLSSRTLASLVSMGLADSRGTVYSTNYGPTSAGRAVARALRKAQA